MLYLFLHSKRHAYLWTGFLGESAEELLVLLDVLDVADSKLHLARLLSNLHTTEIQRGIKWDREREGRGGGREDSEELLVLLDILDVAEREREREPKKKEKSQATVLKTNKFLEASVQKS